jgi:uncharacterized protein (TIGR00375 family)
VVTKESDGEKMKTYFLDLHVHIGRDGDGKAVKITASSHLTLPNILKECVERKGIDLVGIVDCGSSGVLQDLKKLITTGDLIELEKGGWRYQERVTLFAGAELETVELNGGRAHHLCFFPNLVKLEDFARFIWQKVKNKRLSSQVCYLSTAQLFQEVKKREGLFIPAHVFTPYKGLYGNCANSLTDVFGSEAQEIKAIELGLSADRNMALLIPELRERLFLANSDAHSLDKIGREYNQVVMETPCFEDLADLLKGQKGKIVANYGLDPQLGKYHRSYCQQCHRSLLEIPPIFCCPYCGKQDNLVMGVLDRIISIAELQQSNEAAALTREGNYFYQVPLSFLPGVGKKTKDKLLKKFGTEMNVLHQASEQETAELVGKKVASLIIKARQGELHMNPGGGGIYGRITNA